MGKYIKIAWRNVWRNWRRTLIACIAIVLALILVLFLDAFIRGADQAVYGNSVRLYGGNVQVHAPGYRDKARRLPLLPLDDADFVLQKVNEQPNVVVASKRINTGGMLSNREGNQPVGITAIQPQSEAAVSLIAENIDEGRFLVQDDGDSIIISRSLADLLEIGVGDRINLLGQRADESMRQRTMTVVGIFNLGLGDAEKALVYINLPTAQTLYNLREQETEISIILEQVGQEGETLNSLRPELPAYEVDSFQTLRPEFNQALEADRIFTLITAVIVLGMASIGILNLMMMAVFERTREMGVLAALGMKGRQIVTLFMLEGFFIGLVAGTIGCAISWVLISIVSQVGIDMSTFSTADLGEVYALMGDRAYPSLPFSTLVIYGVAVVFIAMLASLFPAWQAARIEPADSLHHI